MYGCTTFIWKAVLLFQSWIDMYVNVECEKIEFHNIYVTWKKWCTCQSVHERDTNIYACHAEHLLHEIFSPYVLNDISMFFVHIAILWNWPIFNKILGRTMKYGYGHSSYNTTRMENPTPQLKHQKHKMKGSINGTC